MQTFRTEIINETAKFSLRHGDGIVMLGSCFAENIGEKLKRFRYSVNVNSHGIIFNPTSLSVALEDIILQRTYLLEDLILYDYVYHSPAHHGRFSHTESNLVLEAINQSISEAHTALKNAKVLMLTFGSAWMYRLKATNKIVANCHKMPGSSFDKELISHQEIEQKWKLLLEQLFAFNPHIEVVFSVSPVRHWRDGVNQNQISKSHLLIAVNTLTNAFHQAHYFPAYEFLLDELRDYRFYKEDMIHPNQVAIDFIWQKFINWCVESKTAELMQKMEPILRFIEHRPMRISEEKHEEVLQQKNSELQRLIKSLV